MGEDFSAKDFRTWAGTVAAARALTLAASAPISSAAKRNVEHLREGGRRPARQHRRRVPQRLHPPGDPGRLRRGRSGPEGAPAIARAFELAVLRFLESRAGA